MVKRYTYQERLSAYRLYIKKVQNYLRIVLRISLFIIKFVLVT